MSSWGSEGDGRACSNWEATRGRIVKHTCLKDAPPQFYSKAIKSRTISFTTGGTIAKNRFPSPKPLVWILKLLRDY